MKTNQLLCCLFLVLAMGCKKDNPAADPEEEKPPVLHDTQDMRVSFPSGTPANYQDYSLFSLAGDARLDASGTAAAAYNEGQTHIAWLFDKDNNPVMAGFVNDTLTTLDAASTAKVLLYYAYSMPMFPEEVQLEFVNSIGNFPGVASWANAFATLMANDRLTLSKGTYLSALETAVIGMKSITEATHGPLGVQKATLGKASLLAAKSADIDVSTGDAKSGLQVFSEELSKVKITNFYRRRTHAFFYKTKFKDLNGVQKGIISEINATTAADKDQSLDPTAAMTSFTGVLGNWLEGKSMDFAAMTTDPPLDFPLEDHESEATYKVRIIGPGDTRSTPQLTNAEERKLLELQVETFAFDFVVPLAASFVSKQMPLKPSTSASEAQKEKFNAFADGIKTVVEEMIKASPDVLGEIRKGQFKNALKKTGESVYAGTNNVVKEKFRDLLGLLAKSAVEAGVYVDPDYSKELAQNRFMKILEVTDKLLEFTDYYNIAYDIKASWQIEDWDLLLKAGQVTLVFEQGHSGLLNTADETKIKAQIKNMAETGGDQHPYFEWSTTGRYGQLRDTKGHSGASFATADHIVSYQSTTNSNDLGDGDNIDSIFVKASFNNQLIGMDTIAVNVKKVSYEMKPADGVVTGKKHNDAAHNVTLYLAKVVTGLRDLPNHEFLDFKVEWATDGVYGELVGNTTTYNDDDIVYKATSDQSGVFTETVNATIYAKNKGETDYFLYGKTSASVKIDNDPKKKILWVPMQEYHGDTTMMTKTGRIYSYNLCIKENGVTFNQDEDAESYSLQFMGMNVVIGAPTGHFWRAGAPSPYPPNEIVGYKGNDGKTYTVIYAWGSKTSIDGEHIEDVHGFLAPVGGARITITLK